MDINETKLKMEYRHPWELSRTKMVLKDISRYISEKHSDKDAFRYINIGAGDMFFDNYLLTQYHNSILDAVDIGYPYEDKSQIAMDRKHQHVDIQECQDVKFDYAIMMDSLEYMEDDCGYIGKLSNCVIDGGYIFLTLPAHKSIYCNHDTNVGNLRRYDARDIDEIVEKVGNLEIVCFKNFYFLLLVFRKLQLLLRVKIDPDAKVTTGWKYSPKNIVTLLVKNVLNIDYRIFRRLPGLSFFVVLRKVG